MSIDVDSGTFYQGYVVAEELLRRGSLLRNERDWTAEDLME